MPTHSLIIPVYKNELNIPDLMAAMRQMHHDLNQDLEVVFVVDGSPDQSYARIKEALAHETFAAKLVMLSKNFGSFAAIRVGLGLATGRYFSVMAADLQEPPELAMQFFKLLKDESVDVVIGTRDGRDDPFFSQLASSVFWGIYKKFIVPDMPKGGIDVFGCNQAFRDKLISLSESHSSLIAQVFWLGFRRKQVYYTRLERQLGVSAWTFKKKVTYMMDSIFSFTDLPIKLLTNIGFLGIIFFLILGSLTIVSKLLGLIAIPGYAALFLAVGFFGAANLFALGIVGSYVWRTYENSKFRPLALVLSTEDFNESI